MESDKTPRRWILTQDPEVWANLFKQQQAAIDYDIILEWTTKKLTGTIPMAPGDKFIVGPHRLFICDYKDGLFTCLIGMAPIDDEGLKKCRMYNMTLQQLHTYCAADGYYYFDYAGYYASCGLPLLHKWNELCKN